MHKDHIVEEVRKTRRKYAAKFGFDLEAIYRDLKEKESRHKGRVVQLAEKRDKKKAGCRIMEYA